MSAHSVRYEHIPCAAIIGRLIRNPNYGGPTVSLNGWHCMDRISNHTKAGFQAALTASIAEEGVRNAILVWSLPEGVFLTFGGSRLKACREAGIARIPAIINDYTGTYDMSPEVTEDTLSNFFQDPPRDYEFGEDGFDYHYNLERARRHDHDPAGFAWIDGTPSFITKEFPWLTEK
jgi:hypothetical protein